MKKCIFNLLFVLWYISANGQSSLNLVDIGDLNSEEGIGRFAVLDPYIEGKDIIMLGEQSHREGTTVRTKYELIKYLHEYHDYDLLLFESDFYGGQKVWQNIENGADAGASFARSIFFVWSATKGFQDFSRYIRQQMEKGDTLTLLGFDNQLSSLEFRDDFEDVKKWIEVSQKIDGNEKKELLSAIDLLKIGNWKSLKKDVAINCIHSLEKLIPKHLDRSFEEQSLLCLQSILSGRYEKADTRDKQMADNFEWLRRRYQNKKIICFGATSHFLFNSEEVRLKGLIYSIADNYYKKSEMMGDYLKDKYGEKLYTIGFTAVQGSIGGWYGGKPKELKAPVNNSLEALILQKYQPTDYFLSFSNGQDFELMTRPIGNAFMSTPANRVMDALIINYDMEPIQRDKEIFCSTFTTNIWVCPENRERMKQENAQK